MPITIRRAWLAPFIPCWLTWLLFHPKAVRRTPESFAQLAKQPRLISLEVTSAGKRKDPPIGFEQAVPGTLVMFTLLVMFTSGGASLLVERRQGILRRLASSPMSRGAVVLGKWGARVTLGFIQIAVRDGGGHSPVQSALGRAPGRDSAVAGGLRQSGRTAGNAAGKFCDAAMAR